MTIFYRVLIGLVFLACATSAMAQPAPDKSTAWTGSETQKIWGLMTVYSEAKYTFPHFDSMPDLDWDKAVQEYIPRVLAAENMDAYYQVLFELVALLKDGHTNIIAPWGHLKPGYDMLPIEVRILNNHFYVDRIGASAELTDQDIKPGAEILAVEGIPVGRYFADNVLRYHADNTKQQEEALLTVYLFYGPAEQKVPLEIQDPGGDIHNVTITRNALSGDSPFMTRMLTNALVAETIKTSTLPGSIQYVEIPNFEHEQVGADFIALIDDLNENTVKGMIIDVRYNTGGSNAISEPMVACLINQAVSSPIMKYRTFCGARVAWGHEPVWDTFSKEIAPREGKRFLGPLVILTGGLVTVRPRIL